MSVDNTFQQRQAAKGVRSATVKAEHGEHYIEFALDMAVLQTQAVNALTKALLSELDRHEIPHFEVVTRHDGKLKSTFVQINPEDHERAQAFADNFNRRIDARDFRLNT